jgi:6-phosphogluconolactonase
MNDDDSRRLENIDVVRWIPVHDAAALRREAYRRIVDCADRAIGERGEFRIVLSGGSTPRGVYRMMRGAETDWSRWQVYFGDERCLSVDDPERNSRMAGETWLDHIPIASNNVHVIPGELGAHAAAQAYAALLRSAGNFDLVLLGLGEDGHTASLFPGHDYGDAVDAPDTLAVLDAPKPPQQRVSLSAARLSRAREILFLVEGENKRDAVTRWRAGENLPAAAIVAQCGIDVLIDSCSLPQAV